MEKKIVPIVIGLLIFWFGWKFGYELEHTHRPQFTETTDTLVVRDTINRDSIVPVEVIKWKTVPEYLAVHDTTFMVDSILVDVPMERRVYEEDSVYYAVVSGYHPSLDALKVYREMVTIETTKKVTEYKPYKWSVSPFVSQEVGFPTTMPKWAYRPNLGATDGFIPEIGYRAYSLDEHAWYAGGRLKFDLIRGK